MATQERKKRSMVWLAAVVPTAVLTVVLCFVYVYFFNKVEETEVTNTYKRYYAFITASKNSDFRKAIYAGALEAAQENGAFVEMLGENLSQDYSVADLMRIANAARFDGIIVEGDENSDEMNELIADATGDRIPVVTLLSDSPNSSRISFVGINSYNLGREYGNRIIDIARDIGDVTVPINVVVLVGANAGDAAQNILCTAIRDTIDQAIGAKQYAGKIGVELYTVDGTNSFSVEESVRNLFMEKREDLPKIIVCLDETDTASVYQAVVDYNRVGEVRIIGNYDSSSILNAINRNVIDSTISVNAKQMGRFCVDALEEYAQMGNTSQYFTADITLIDTKNVNEYLEDTK